MQTSARLLPGSVFATICHEWMDLRSKSKRAYWGPLKVHQDSKRKLEGSCVAPLEYGFNAFQNLPVYLAQLFPKMSKKVSGTRKGPPEAKRPLAPKGLPEPKKDLWSPWNILKSSYLNWQSHFNCLFSSHWIDLVSLTGFSAPKRSSGGT